MKDSRRQDIRSPQIQKAHYQRGKEGEQGVRVAINDELRKMHEREERAHHDQPPDRVSEALLEEPPEVDLFGKGNSRQLIEHRTQRQHAEGLSRQDSKKGQGNQDDDRCGDAGDEVLPREPEVEPSLNEERDGEKKDRNYVSQKREGKGMIYEYQDKQRRIRIECLFPLCFQSSPVPQPIFCASAMP